MTLEFRLHIAMAEIHHLPFATPLCQLDKIRHYKDSASLEELRKEKIGPFRVQPSLCLDCFWGVHAPTD